jgi:hypothetical protein
VVFTITVPSLWLSIGDDALDPPILALHVDQPVAQESKFADRNFL